MYELDSTRNWYADWQWGGDWSYGKKQRKTFLHEPSCNFWFLNNGNSTGIKIFYIYIFFEKNWLSIATGAWKTTTFAAPFSSPPALEILPGPERQQRWSLGGAAVQTEHGANSPTLVYTVKKFLFTTYSWESGQGPDGPGLALAWVLLQIFHPSNPKAEKSKVGWW